MPQQIAGGIRAHALALSIASLLATTAGAGQQAVASHEVMRPRQAPREVARVNGTPIMSDRLDAAVARLIPMESFHRNVSAEKRAALRQQALQTLEDEELEYQEGVRQRIAVPADAMRVAWSETVARNGGPRALEEVLRRTGSSMEAARAEVRRMLTIRLTYDRSVTAKCRVSRDEAAQFFGANPNRFVEPEQLHIHAITVGVDPSSTAAQWTAAKALAAQALAELQAGATFEDVAARYSTDPSKAKGGDMGFVHRGSLSERLEQAAKDLPVGRASEVVETLFGYHIIRVSEIRPARKMTFDDVSAKLQEELTDTHCTAQKDIWLAALRANAHMVSSEQQP